MEEEMRLRTRRLSAVGTIRLEGAPAVWDSYRPEGAEPNLT